VKRMKRVKRALPFAFLLLLIACPKPVSLQPPEPVITQPMPEISALVRSVPQNIEILFEGKSIGQTPANLKVYTIDQLSGGFSAANASDEVVEQRVSVITEKEVEVTLTFDLEQSKMAKALNLSRILVFDYGEGITFDFNKSEIKPDFKPLLERQAEMLKNYFSGIDVYICGHSDSIGRRERNLELSLERAMSVYEKLKADGVPRESMKVKGFGSDYPLVSNDTEAGRARNRRIEIILGQ